MKINTSETIHHMIFIYSAHVENNISSCCGFFSIFENFDFPGSQGGERAKNNLK